MRFVGQPAEGVGLTGLTEGGATKGECKSKPAPFPKTPKGMRHPSSSPHLSVLHPPPGSDPPVQAPHLVTLTTPPRI